MTSRRLRPGRASRKWHPSDGPRALLELCDALLGAHLLPQPISLGRDGNDAFSHLRDVVLPSKSFTALSLDRTVGAHPLSVVGPLAWPNGTDLSHAHHFRTFVYP